MSISNRLVPKKFENAMIISRGATSNTEARRMLLRTELEFTKFILQLHRFNFLIRLL